MRDDIISQLERENKDLKARLEALYREQDARRERKQQKRQLKSSSSNAVINATARQEQQQHHRHPEVESTRKQ